MASESTNDQNCNINHEGANIIDVNKCKNCGRQFKILSKHLSKRKICKSFYSEQDIKSVSKILKQQRWKKYSQQNKHQIAQKKYDHYHKNSEKILQKMAVAYQKKKKMGKHSVEDNK